LLRNLHWGHQFDVKNEKREKKGKKEENGEIGRNKTISIGQVKNMR
jgi:hypothetical protein